MTERPAPREALFGWLTLCMIVLQGLAEWCGAGFVIWPLSVVLLAMVVLMALRARGSGAIFLLICAVLAVLLILFDPDWQEVLRRAALQAGFLAAFFSALTLLRNAAAGSEAMAAAGRFLSSQKPGRRYLSLTFGTQIFAPVLNFGAIQLLGTMAVQSSSEDEGETRRAIRIRRMLLAIQRGYLAALPWSPLAFASAIAVATLPGVSWAGLALPGLVTSALVIVAGWWLDHMAKPAVAPGATPHEVQGSWRSLVPLIWLFCIMLGPVLLLESLCDVRIVGVVLVVVPIVAGCWMRIQTGSGREIAVRLHDWVRRELPGCRGNLVLLMSAGFIGTVGTELLHPVLAAADINLAGWPGWVLLLALVWILPLAGQVGANPILSLSMLAPLLPPAAAVGLNPTAYAVAALCGWTLTGLTSPFTATNLLVGGLGGIPARSVGTVWNRNYMLIIGPLLTVWALLFGVLSA